MPRPVKIKKAKSFMFTTKHHSALGVFANVLCIISFIIMIVSINMAFFNKGKSSIAIGGVDFGAAVLDAIGIITGIAALKERDIHKWVPGLAIFLNLLILGLWISLVMLGQN